MNMFIRVASRCSESAGVDTSGDALRFIAAIFLKVYIDFTIVAYRCVIKAIPVAKSRSES